MRGFRKAFRRAVTAGGVVVLVTSTVVLAAVVFTDQIVWSGHSVTSPERARAADLKVAAAVGSFPTPPGTDCAALSANAYQDSGDAIQAFQVENIEPGATNEFHYVCLKNNGAKDAALKMEVTGLENLETACTGDEPLVDDTCGAGLPGELAERIQLSIIMFTSSLCEGTQGPLTTRPLTEYVGSPATIQNVLTKGTARCAVLGVFYSPYDADFQALPEETLQAAQTDSASWNVVFSTATS